jgi:hypothetical protein
MPVFDIGPISTLITISFEVTKALTMQVKDQTGTATPKTFQIPYSDGTAVTLGFDNDCGTGCTHNDSLDLYEIFSDKDGRTQFATGRINQGYMTGLTSPHSSLDLLSSTYGNCDPFMLDPPPGP